MTSPRGRVKVTAGRWIGWIAGAGTILATTTAIAASGATTLLYERTVMTSANARCGLFAPAVGAALEAGRIQARGAALRGGSTSVAVGEVERRARSKIAGTACDAADLQTAAKRVRTAFEGYAKLQRMTWPGDYADWRGDRMVSRDNILWRLAQTSVFGYDRMIFGMGGKSGQGVPLAAVSFSDDASPYTARLVMRDPARAQEAYLDRRLSGMKGRMPLSSRMPPAGATRSFSAEARSPASERLLPKGSKSGVLYRFPMRAADAMATLDPREAVVVEFVFSGPKGDTVRRAYIEVGDFAAGRAFLNIG